MREKLYYEDRYDIGTIERCLEVVDFWKNRVKEENLKGLEDDTIKAKTMNLGLNLGLYYLQGERFKEREAIIKEWMDRDRKLDETVEKAQKPKGIRCVACLGHMKVISKDLRDMMGQPLRVIFMFECLKCHKRRAFFDDGQEYLPKPDLCPKCNKEIETTFRQEGHIEIWERTCGACGFLERELDDTQEWQAKQEAKRLNDENLLIKYRSEYCLSEKEGTQYILDTGLMKDTYDYFHKKEQKESDPDYPKVEKLKKLGIVDLEKLLSTELEKQKYIKLSLEQPDIDKFVIVRFNIQDADSSRKDRDSEYKLRKLIKDILVGTNWRLMSEGVTYRLGYLSGRLKGYENEDDLLKVVKLDK
jgi:Zn ribbon nucleic-acid-binding protein